MAARLPHGLRIEHTGASLPSIPHIDMTLASMRARGVIAAMVEPGIWEVRPGPIGPRDTVIEPDLSNAAPFLAAPSSPGAPSPSPGGQSTQHRWALWCQNF